MRRRSEKSDVKSPCLTWELHSKLSDLSVGEVSGIPGVAVKCVEMCIRDSGNAAPSVQAAADMVTARNDEGGFAKALETLIF